MRLLIVEDSELIRKVTRLAFPTKEHDVVDAEDGQAALELLDAATAPFDAILLDLNMPRMDGVQFLPALRDRPRYLDTPVVLATSERKTSQLLRDALPPLLRGIVDRAKGR
jgi:two-component system chemotaxis response regulator CheY